MASAAEKGKGYGFGTFQGVFTPSILTIIGVVMYLRFGWVLGSVGLVPTLVIVTGSSLITFLTGLSISALATNMKMGGGGAYYMISRSFGVEVGAAVGLPLYLSQAISIAFYVVGFTEAFVHAVPAAAGWDPRFVSLATLGGMALMATLSASVALRSQYIVMAAIALSRSKSSEPSICSRARAFFSESRAASEESSARRGKRASASSMRASCARRAES